MPQFTHNVNFLYSFSKSKLIPTTQAKLVLENYFQGDCEPMTN